MDMTPKHHKLLACAAGPRGVSTSLYMKEAEELRTAGLLEIKEVFTTGGNRCLRLFLKAGA